MHHVEWNRNKSDSDKRLSKKILSAVKRLRTYTAGNISSLSRSCDMLVHFPDIRLLSLKQAIYQRSHLYSATSFVSKVLRKYFFSELIWWWAQTVYYRNGLQDFFLKSPESFKYLQEMSPVCNEGCVVSAVGCRWCLGRVSLLIGGRRHCSRLYLDALLS